MNIIQQSEWKLLEDLCTADAPSGNEGSVREIIEAACRDFADEMYTDTLGNLVVVRRGRKNESKPNNAGVTAGAAMDAAAGKEESAQAGAATASASAAADAAKARAARQSSGAVRLMLAAHMDEIGVIVTYIEESGLLRFAPVGGVQRGSLAGSRVRFLNGTVGAVFCAHEEPDSDKRKISDYCIDIGADSRQAAEKCVSIGDVAAFVGRTERMGNRVLSKALDNRAGCWVLIQALRQAAHTENDVYAVFTVQEELGLRGAQTSAYAIDADVALAVDVTRTGDVPGAQPMDVRLGGGAAIKVMDSYSMSHPALVELLRSLAAEAGIAVQTEVLTRGGTDAAAMQRTRGGTVAGTISIPTRGIHSPCEVADLGDMAACAALTARLIEADLRQLL